MFDDFKNINFLITGANGLIGSELVFSLLALNRTRKSNIKVFALVRNIKKAKEKFKQVLNNENFKFIEQDIKNPIKCEEKIDYIIHCASITSSKEMIEKPADVILTSFEGMKNVLNFAFEKKSKVLYLSSLEAYGIINKEEKIKEEDFGYIDSTNPRSSYPQSKKIAENLCAAYISQYGVDVKIIRLTQTFGAGISINDNRVFAQFAKSALEKRDIILYTNGETTRNYCYLTDAIVGMFYVLKYGKVGEIYNLSNEKTAICIKDMAKMLAEKHSLNLKFEIDSTNRGYNPTIKMCLDSSKLQKLGWCPKIGIEEMFERTIEYLKEKENVF